MTTINAGVQEELGLPVTLAEMTRFLEREIIRKQITLKRRAASSRRRPLERHVRVMKAILATLNAINLPELPTPKEPAS